MLRAACDLQFLLPLTENTSKTMHHCSALSATFNSYCHQTRKPRKPCTNAPRCLRPSIPTAPLLCAVCDLQFLLPLNEKTSKTMHHCSALSATFNSYCHQMRKPRKPCTNAPRCLRPSIPTAIKCENLENHAPLLQRCLQPSIPTDIQCENPR